MGNSPLLGQEIFIEASTSICVRFSRNHQPNFYVVHNNEKRDVTFFPKLI